MVSGKFCQLSVVPLRALATIWVDRRVLPMTVKDLFARDTDDALNAKDNRRPSVRGGWIFFIVIAIVSWSFLAPWFWAALMVAFVISYRVLGRNRAGRDLLFEKRDQATPNPRHLLWALPLGILICAAWWWFEAGLWHYGDYYRASKAEIAAFDSTSVKNYIGTALIGAIPILAANWSRTPWPRLALAVVLVAANLLLASIFVLAPRAVR